MISADFIQKYLPIRESVNTIPAILVKNTTEDNLIHHPSDDQITTNSNPQSAFPNPQSAFPNPQSEIRNPQSDLDSLIQQIESAQIDITSTYNAWLRILFALTDYLGESGREYAHRISQFHPGYKPSDCDKQFNYCLRSGKSGITIRTLFYIAQQHGFIVHNNFTDWADEFSIQLPSFSNPQIPAFSNSQLIQSPPTHNSSLISHNSSPQSDIPNPTSDIPNPTSAIPNPQSDIGNPNSAIPNPQSEILPFPVHIFPPPVADLISAAARSIGCPPDFIAIPVLAVLATAIGNSRHIQVKKGWTEAPTIYSAIVAPPGSKKSPALSAATLPVREIQQAYSLEHKNAQDEYLSKLSAYNIQVELWKKRKPEDKDPADQPNPPLEPFMKQIKTNNATIEAIGNLLEQNPRGILFEQDELAAWAKSMNAYRSGKGSDLEIWLSFWSCIQVIINRAYRKVPQSIDKPHVTVTGCIQPDLLSDLSGIKQNGFFDRILFSYPDSVPLHYSTDEISDFLAGAYGDVVKTLFQLQPDIVENQVQVPSLMHFTIPARREWENWNRLHDSEMNNPDLPYYLLGAWSKLQAYMARFILIMQLTSNAVKGIDSREIHPESVLAAAQLLKYFKSHTRKVYDTMYNSEMDGKIGVALNWIKRHDGSATERMMLNNKVGSCKSVAQVRELLQEMVDRQLGVLTSSAPSHGGRPKVMFTLYNSAIAQNPSQPNDSQ